MQVMNELWEEVGYENLALTNENLRDQVARLEKTLGNVAETISRRVGIRENQTRKKNLEIEESTTSNSNSQEEAKRERKTLVLMKERNEKQEGVSVMQWNF